MPEIPDEAVTAAGQAIRHLNAGRPEDFARVALEAAAPILAETVAQRILAHAERRPKVNHGPLGAWHRHFGIAARVAAGAFDTREDQLRMAAEAIKRGDFITCNIPEVPQ